MNAHHQLWEKEKNDNKNGTELFKLLADHNLSIATPPDTPTYLSHRAPHATSTIDLTITSANIEKCIKKYRLRLDINPGIDHRPIEFTLETKLTSPTPTPTPIKSYPNFNLTNWDEFNKSLKTNLPPIPTEPTTINPSALQELTDSTIAAIHETIRTSVPHRKFNPNYQNTWWTEKYTKLKKARNKELRELRKDTKMNPNHEQANKTKVKKINKNYFKKIRAAKRQHTHEAATKISNTWKTYKKFISQKDSQPIYQMKKEDDTITNKPQEISEIFRSRFFKQSTIRTKTGKITNPREKKEIPR